MRVLSARLVAGLLIASAVAACEPFYQMIYENRTDVRVTVEVIGAIRPASSIRLQMDPGATATGVWIYPRPNDTTKTVVRAFDPDGAEVFCRRFSYDEARGDLRWTVEIERGVRRCS